jgi:iron complex outermembrane recepter protein
MWGRVSVALAAAASGLVTGFGAAQGQELPKPPEELPPIEILSAPANKAKPGNPHKTLKKAPQLQPLPDNAAAIRPAHLDAKPGFYDPALDIGNLKFPPGTTITTAGPVDGYRALTAFSATKTATPIEQIPQSIQVIPRSVIDGQGDVNLTEAIQNVSGVVGTSQVRTPGYDFPTVRGFEAEQWLDGLSVFYDTGNRDSLANVERIEILKGPNAILYGGGNGAPVGGAVDVISKLPTDKASGEFGFTYGSEDYVHPYFDVNQPLNSNGTVLFRMTGENTSTQSFIDTLDAERYSLNPTLTFTDKTDTTLTLQGRVTHWSQQEYQGLPGTGTVAGDFNIDRTLFIGPDDMPKSSSGLRGLTASLDHRIVDGLSLHTKARWSQTAFLEKAQITVGSDGLQANTPVLPPSTWILSNGVLSQEADEAVATANVEAQFTWGLTSNRVLVGGDYSRIFDRGFFGFDLPLGGAGLVDLANPSFPFPYVQPLNTAVTSIGSGSKTYVNDGIFAQVQSTLAGKLHLLGALRLANVEIGSAEDFTGARDATRMTRLLPHVGAVFDLTEELSVYLSYGEGLKGEPLLAVRGTPKPEPSREREAGIKINLANGLTGTAAVFEIERSNVPNSDGVVITGFSEEKSEGFEADILWQPDAYWRLLCSYAFIDASVAVSTAGPIAGNKLVAIPEQSGRVWVDYRFDSPFLQGWSAGAGAYIVTSQAVEISNTYFTDGYVTVDAKVGYDTAKFSAAIAVRNLLEEKYFVPYDFFRGRVAPGDPRTVYATVVYRY